MAKGAVTVDYGLEGSVVLVTGGNSGIGAATVRAFAAQGAWVAIHYLAENSASDGDYAALHSVAGREAALSLSGEAAALAGEAIAVPADLSDIESVPRVYDAVEDGLGPVAILVNNAAHCEDPDTIFTMTEGTFDRTFGVNARGSLLLIAEYVRRYQESGRDWGRIISLSTDAAQSFAGQINYGASKATIEAFTRSVAREIGPLGITVNAVAPGPVQTGYITPQFEKELLPDIPMRRLGRPEDIAQSVLFLASQQASWITGQVIHVSGGHCV